MGIKRPGIFFARKENVIIQHTIKREVRTKGIGLHSGRECSIAFSPAIPDTGVVFRRNGVEMKALFKNVTETILSTNLASNGVKIRTIEHLLASLGGLGIHNIIIDVKGPELPIMDGSAGEFVSLLLKAEPVSQSKPQPYIKILKPVLLSEGGSYVMALPSKKGYSISCRLKYNHPVIREEKMSLKINKRTFVNELATARTFGFLKDVNSMRARGLARGGSLENAIVIGDDRVLNKEGLRFKNEFVRHKMLDIIGDMALLGYPIEGHIIANESGHRLNIDFLKHLDKARDAWEIVATKPQREIPGKYFHLTQEVAA